MISPEELTAFLTVIGIDLVLSGDNAIVIGTAAAGLPAELRRRAIVIGIAVAAATRVLFALTTFYLLKIIGLLLAGGLLLLWVTWKMWRDIRAEAEARKLALANGETPGESTPASRRGVTFRSALIAIVLADVTMSLDNILAVAGAAKDYLVILVFGLALSIALMGLAATFIAGLMNRYHWISYLGVALVAYVALDMIWRGWHEVALHLGPIIGG